MPIHHHYQHSGVEGIRVGRFNKGINTTFIVYRIDDTLIDCGPTNQWQVVRPFVLQKPVRQLLLTHHHEDHSGNAASVAKECNIKPFAPELARERLASGYAIPSLQKLIWGTLKPVQTDPYPAQITLSDGRTLIPVHTPGHADDLHCFHEPREGWLFSGDLYISKSLRYLRFDENLTELIASINKVLKLDFEVLFCPHRGILTDGKQALQKKSDNLTRLVEQVQGLAAKGNKAAAITDKLMGRGDWFALITFNGFSKRNLVEQALKVDLSGL